MTVGATAVEKMAAAAVATAILLIRLIKDSSIMIVSMQYNYVLP
jgi:hypothetical protein